MEGLRTLPKGKEDPNDDVKTFEREVCLPWSNQALEP
jgi:hypothetical protein